MSVLFTFGKHKRIPVEEVPLDYLEWIWKNVEFKSSILKDAVWNRIEYFRAEADSLRFDPGAKAVNEVFRSLSVKHHPDKGGNVEAFKAILEFRNALKALGDMR